ncbi:MAG: HAMP domain-containing histidine kinase [Acidobacteriaceae bacterium]|nr:HAMP domain-containing histidine kinase [Acidobacteriaceae bacterium]MBV9779242.1 HAMP domain-containing histidine kinase [Acidobacteriaceae bacterium]
MEDSFDSDLTHETLIHDLNNVFETITESAELLSADRHWKPLAATLCRCVERGKRLLGAIPDSTPNLADVIDHAVQSVTDYSVATRKPRIRFVRQFPADLRLPGSAKDWERVFVNLFMNAAQIMSKPGRIEIAAERVGDSLALTVSDNGPGIPVDILPRVFRPNVSTKANRSGRSGLGLHIVASIVKKYSGRVSAANREPAAGAVFTILLPGT